jgi:hypothetical protein
MKNYIILLATIVLFSCEDKIDLSNKLKNTESQLVVDAFLNNLPETQTVVLSGTQPFYDNSSQKLISGATVTLTDVNTGTIFPFAEIEMGKFVSSTNGDMMLKVGHEYALNINYKDENFVAYSKMNRVVAVDSLFFVESETFSGEKKPGKYFAEFLATDSLGAGDRYWVRFYRNGVRNTQPEIINVVYDGSLGQSTQSEDSLVFIQPLRTAINESGEDKEYVANETLMVEIYSINSGVAFFLSSIASLSQQSSGGAFGALFSQPPYNLPTNIQNTNEKGSKPVGYFCTSAVSNRLSTTVPFSAGNGRLKKIN